MTPQIYQFFASTHNFVKKHHAILFISLLAVIVAYAITSFYQALTISFEKPINTNSTIQNFDQKTVDKIKNLHDSSDTSVGPIVLPSPRANPFSE